MMEKIAINYRRGSRCPAALVLGKDSKDSIGDPAFAKIHHWLSRSELLASPS